MTGSERQSFADGPVARLIAVLVILVCAATLAYLHRETLFHSGDTTEAVANPELAACLAERLGAVDKMQADGVINQAQYDVFRGRAEAFCQQQFGDSNGPPGPPR